MALPDLKLPAALIAPLRSVLQAQGYSAAIVKDDGSLDAGQILASTYDTVEFRTRFTPPMKIRTADLVSSQRGVVAPLFQPAVTVSGRFGKVAIAPYGVPEESTGILGTIGVVSALIGVGYMLGRAQRK